MSTPDRWERMVERRNRAPFNDVPWIYSNDAVMLLKRQYAQMVRVVKGQKPPSISSMSQYSSFLRGKLVACNNILAALARWKGGKP